MRSSAMFAALMLNGARTVASFAPRFHRCARQQSARAMLQSSSSSASATFSSHGLPYSHRRAFCDKATKPAVPRWMSTTSTSSLPSSSYDQQYADAAGSGDAHTQGGNSDVGAEPVLGGDFAGLAATFSPADGSLIEVPTYLIPEALIEWGQEPKCLEILVSEDFVNGHGMERTTLTVLPETGCGIDNLDTQKSKDSMELSSSTVLGDNVKGAIALQYSTTSQDNLRVETIFGLRREQQQQMQHHPNDDGTNLYRIRVVLDLIPNEEVFAIQSPMLVTKERRTSSTSTSGTRADGGGLDGRTVSQLLGDELRKTPTFAEQATETSGERDSIQYVYLPDGISLAYGWTPSDEWILQVAHEEDGIRRVVARKFSVVSDKNSSGGQLEFDVESWEEDV
mmetsp:Transcript_12374/g.34073  ORF Transcript_12374/g.34073 Transcript_12374/m.34073 type:complete len:395 (-) Transcript_12374:100-1284(-)